MASNSTSTTNHPAPSGSDVLDFLDSLDVAIQPSSSLDPTNRPPTAESAVPPPAAATALLENQRVSTPLVQNTAHPSTSLNANPFLSSAAKQNAGTPTSATPSFAFTPTNPVVQSALTPTSAALTPNMSPSVNRATQPSLTPYAAPTTIKPPFSTKADDPAPSNTSHTNWSSWFSSASANDIMSKASSVANKVSDQLRHESQRAFSQASSVAQHAREKANQTPATSAAVAQGSKLFDYMSKGVTGLLDMVAPDSLDLNVTVTLSGLCNVAEVTNDTWSVLESVFGARDMRLIATEMNDSQLRHFLPEEIADCTPEKAWAKLSSQSPEPTPDTHINVAFHPLVSIPFQPLLSYLVHVSGSGSITAYTVSQSFHPTGPHADPEWTRMVLRAALRTTVDDFLADLVAADGSRFTASRARAPSQPPAPSNVVEQEHDMLIHAGAHF